MFKFDLRYTMFMLRNMCSFAQMCAESFDVQRELFSSLFSLTLGIVVSKTLSSSIVFATFVVISLNSYAVVVGGCRHHLFVCIRERIRKLVTY